MKYLKSMILIVALPFVASCVWGQVYSFSAGQREIKVLRNGCRFTGIEVTNNGSTYHMSGYVRVVALDVDKRTVGEANCRFGFVIPGSVTEGECIPTNVGHKYDPHYQPDCAHWNEFRMVDYRFN